MGMDQRADLAEVLAANARFYEAFRSGDMVQMDMLWSQRDSVSVYHPNWPGITGRLEVMTSWHQVMVLSEPPAIFARDTFVVREGNAAIVFCTEDVDGHQLTASNVFVNEDGLWKLTCHHARPLPKAGDDGVGGADDFEDGDGLDDGDNDSGSRF